MWRLSLMLAVTLPMVHSQIPSNVLICYSNQTLNQRELRLGFDLQTLVGIIEKIEHDRDGQYFDPQRLVTTMIARFRIDGIHQLLSETQDQYTVPLTLYPAEKAKWHVIKNLIPGNGDNFPESSISQEEKCVLHWIMSYTINQTKRMDDDSGNKEDCSQPRNKRGAPSLTRLTRQVKTGGVLPDPDKLSNCPLEMGVIRTKWGPVAAGNLLAGIAAGLAEQDVTVDEAVNQNTDTLQSYQSEERNRRINNIWGSTLSGDLAQSALLYYQKTSNLVGTTGFWKQTYCPHRYVIKNVEDQLTALTNAEIYGGIDGLLIGLGVQEWTRQNSQLKLSQILRMYYSEEGVSFDPTLRACDRITNFQDSNYVPQDTLINQAVNFFYAYYASEPGPATPQLVAENLNDFFTTVVTDATSDLNSFASRNAYEQDFKRCTDDDDQTTTQMRADVMFVMDTSRGESDLDMQRILVSELALGMDIGWNRSRMSVLSGRDGSVVIPFEKYINNGELACKIQQQYIPSGSLNLVATLQKVQEYYTQLLQQEYNDVPAHTNSQIIILLLTSSRLNNEDDIEDEIQNLINIFPDVNIMSVASSKSALNSIIQDLNVPQFDPENVFLMEGAADSIRKNMVPELVTAIDTIPSRFTYSRCLPRTNDGFSEERHELEMYVSPGYTSYLSLGAEQFSGSENLRIKITSKFNTVKICYSRTNMNPEEDDDDSRCDFTSGSQSGHVTFTWGLPCSDGFGNCNPIYMSFIVNDGSNSANSPTTSPLNMCTDDTCPFPDSAKVTLTHENLKCGAWGLLAAPLSSLLVLAILLNKLVN